MNKSDTIFIKEIIKTAKRTNCGYLNKHMQSYEISGTFKSELIKKLIDENLCYDIIWNYIGLYNYKSSLYHNNKMGIEHYPVYNVLVNNALYLEKAIQYLINSDYLNDCTYLIKFDKSHIEFIYHLLAKNNKIQEYINTNFNKMNKCKLGNLILLTNSFKDGYIEDVKYSNTITFPKLETNKK